MTYDMDKAYSTHAISRSLIPLLSLLPLEGFHLSVSAEPTPTVLLPELGIPSHSMGVCIVVWWLEGQMLLVRNPLHRARSCARVWWKLLGIGSSWSPRHLTPHTTGHVTGDSTWDVALHLGRDLSRYTARNIHNWRATTCI